jgi:hypothetical protein
MLRGDDGGEAWLRALPMEFRSGYTYVRLLTG